MKVDMHYYATYAIALAAGIPKSDARILAYASQYVDDSKRENGEPQPRDKSLFVSMTTAHHPLNCVFAQIQEPDYQRKVWIPNHFIPGGHGETFEEKSLCEENSEIARKMFEEHIELACGSKEFGLELIGIATHAYMDTFSHYGFSGFCSSFNNVKSGTIATDGGNGKQEAILKGKLEGLSSGKKKRTDYFIEISSFFIEGVTGSLGHGPVLSLPDLPFLKWKFQFEKNRPGNGCVSHRDNPAHFFKATQCLHEWLSIYAKKRYDMNETTPFSEIQETIRSVLATEGDDKERVAAWKTSGLLPADTEAYDPEEWERTKNDFGNRMSIEEGIKTPVYRFHQAAAYHRYYMLKDLLPRYGIAVY